MNSQGTYIRLPIAEGKGHSLVELSTSCVGSSKDSVSHSSHWNEIWSDTDARIAHACTCNLPYYVNKVISSLS